MKPLLKLCENSPHSMEERLQKLIAASGYTSRRKAEELIIAGKVRVNGKIIRELGVKASTNDEIVVNGTLLEKPDTVTYLLYKPRGVICSRRSQGSKDKLVTSLVPEKPTVYPVGRLDKESEGLILLTNDGALTHKLTHPSSHVIKEYRVHAAWKGEGMEPDAPTLQTRLQAGVRLSDGKIVPDRVQVRKGEQPGHVILILAIHEGRHHAVRRMCAAAGYRVKRLERTAIGSLKDTRLKLGQYRRLSGQELRNHFG